MVAFGDKSEGGTNTLGACSVRGESRPADALPSLPRTEKASSHPALDARRPLRLEGPTVLGFADRPPPPHTPTASGLCGAATPS